MNLIPMTLACSLIMVLATLAERRPADRALLWVAFALVVVMAAWHGFYWNLFGRGHGLFSANRVSAVIVFVALFYGTFMLAMLRRASAVMQANGITGAGPRLR